MIDDPDILELRANQRRAALKKLGIAVIVVLGAAGAIVPTGGAITSMLQEKGHTEVEVSRKGLFDFGFKSKRADKTCEGSVSKFPGGHRLTQMCLAPGGGLEMSETDSDGTESGTITP